VAVEVVDAPAKGTQENGTIREPAVTPASPPKAPEKRAKVNFPLLVLAFAIVAALVAWVIFSRTRPVAGIAASGTIEATESDVSPKVEGRLAELRVHDGDEVTKGQVLAVLERLDPTLNLDQARAAVATANANVAAAQAAYDLQKATYATSLAQAGEGVSIAQSSLGQAGENLSIETRAATLAVDQADAQISAARSAYDHAETSFSRARSLVRTGDVAQQTLDDATSVRATAAAQLKEANDALALAEANRRNVAIRALAVSSSRAQRSQSVSGLELAKAGDATVAQRQAQLSAAQGQLAQARAALALAQDQLRETQLVAPFAGAVISHNFEVGDLIQPGSAVLTIGDLTHPYLYVYVSESNLAHVKSGTHANVKIDGMPDRTFVGTVTEISNTAEFTPENVQTQQERIEYLVFRVKLGFTDTTGALKPGLPADAVLPE
jgi:HlyD family secretion protein